MLGGTGANPWVRLLEQEPFNFEFEGPKITNRNPAPGELKTYLADNKGHGYARLALVPNLTRSVVRAPVTSRVLTEAEVHHA